MEISGPMKVFAYTAAVVLVGGGAMLLDNNLSGKRAAKSLAKGMCLQTFNDNAAEVKADLNAQVEDYHATSPDYKFDEIFTVGGRDYNCTLHMDGTAPVLDITLAPSND